MSNLLAAVPSPLPSIIITQPAGTGVPGGAELTVIISQLFTIVFSIAALLVLVMLIWGAINWILSAGDKEKVGAARNRIINALVGLAILALAFLIANVVGRIVGIDVFNLQLPQLGR